MLWKVVCDMRNAVTLIQSNCCDTGCAGIDLDVTVIVVDPNTIRILYAGTIPNQFVDDSPASTITITDSVGGGPQSSTVNLIANYYAPSQYYEVTLTGPNGANDIYVSTTYRFIDPVSGEQCSNTIQSIGLGVDTCPTLVLAADYTGVNYAFTWNGTTAGVKVPNGDWIKDDRKGLTLCDATSAVLAMDIAWNKLDVTTFSWQKVLGGEAQHGILVLSPRAIKRLEEYKPTWPIPKLFRLANKGKFQAKIFQGSTINTPSMLCIEDALNSLKWVKSIGGLYEMIKRSKSNLDVIEEWVKKTNWVAFLANDVESRSSTSICLKIKDPWFLDKDIAEQKNIIKSFFSMLEEKEAAYDINHYPSAPLGIRIWGGGTIEQSNIKLLLPWLDWAWSNLSKV